MTKQEIAKELLIFDWDSPMAAGKLQAIYEDLLKLEKAEIIELFCGVIETKFLVEAYPDLFNHLSEFPLLTDVMKELTRDKRHG